MEQEPATPVDAAEVVTEHSQMGLCKKIMRIATRRTAAAAWQPLVTCGMHPKQSRVLWRGLKEGSKV